MVIHTFQYDARCTQRHINTLQYDARYTQRQINTLQYDARYTQRHINTLQYDARYTQRQIKLSSICMSVYFGAVFLKIALACSVFLWMKEMRRNNN